MYLGLWQMSRDNMQDIVYYYTQAPQYTYNNAIINLNHHKPESPNVAMNSVDIVMSIKLNNRREAYYPLHRFWQSIRDIIHEHGCDMFNVDMEELGAYCNYYYREDGWLDFERKLQNGVLSKFSVVEPTIVNDNTTYVDDALPNAHLHSAVLLAIRARLCQQKGIAKSIRTSPSTVNAYCGNKLRIHGWANYETRFVDYLETLLQTIDKTKPHIRDILVHIDHYKKDKSAQTSDNIYDVAPIENTTLVNWLAARPDTEVIEIDDSSVSDTTPTDYLNNTPSADESAATYYQRVAIIRPLMN